MGLYFIKSQLSQLDSVPLKHIVPFSSSLPISELSGDDFSTNGKKAPLLLREQFVEGNGVIRSGLALSFGTVLPTSHFVIASEKQKF